MDQGRTLVVMNNGDVYYVSPEAAEGIAVSLAMGGHMTEFRDVKSGATVTLNLSNVSAVVRETNRG